MTTATPPGPGFVAGTLIVSGIQPGVGYGMARLLITHPSPRYPGESQQSIQDGMSGLAASLGLGPGDQDPPVVGYRLRVHGGTVALDYGHDEYLMRLPGLAPSWVEIVAHGAPCRIALVLTPLALSSDPAGVDVQLRDSLARGDLVWGTAYARRPFAQAQQSASA